MKNKNQQGITLIELLIVVAIMALLATQAYPVYQRYIYRTHRQAASADLMTIQQQLTQQYHLNNGSYTLPKGLDKKGDCQTVSHNTSGTPPRYRIDIELTENKQSYTLTATPCTNQHNDQCGTLRLDSDGFRSVLQNGEFIADGQCF